MAIHFKKLLKVSGLVIVALGCLGALLIYAPDESAKPGTIRVACVGDSITFGLLAVPRAFNTYPAQLKKMLGEGYSVRNFGVNAHTAQKAADRPYWQHRDFQKSTDYAPNVVVIMLGTNDAKAKNWKGQEQFLQDYGALVTHYQSLPSKPAIYLMSPPAAFLVRGKTAPEFGIGVEAIQEISAGIKRLASERNVGFIDINAITATHAEYFGFDGVHPNVEGTKLIAESVYAALVSPASAPLQLPKVSAPIPVTAASKPFLGARAAMEAVGYVEEEYFLSGQANVYDWMSDRKPRVVAGPGKYTTRILVRRPRDPAKFSGNVELTVLNASLNADFGGPTDFGRMVEQGDVWIGITSKPVTANALKQFDSVRYASLDWSNPAPLASRCTQPTIIPTDMIGGDNVLWIKTVMWLMATTGIGPSKPETEDGLVWDMLGQLGLLLKSEQRDTILPGFSKPWVYMTGVSQSAIYIRTWVKAFHDRYRTPDGKPVYDGYLAVVGPALARINQCAADVPLVDPAQKLTPPDVPFISLSSEGEMWQARYTHQPDVSTPGGGIVSYEVAGASHMPGEIPGQEPDTLAFASPADMTRAGVKGADGLATTDHNYDFVWAPVIRGAFHNLQLWVREGIKPPQAPGIEIDVHHEIKRDRYGNALGGVRLPYIDVPVAEHTGYRSAGGMGGIRGEKQPFSPETLKQLYPDHATYVAKFSAATDRFASGRWISTADAVAMKKAANSAPVPH